MALVVDVPGVNTAVEHLQELADRMQHDFGFSDDDVNNIDQVIEALRQLIHLNETRDRVRQTNQEAHTTEKTKEQKKINVDKKKDLDILHDKLMDSEGKLDSLRKSLRRFETNKAKLEGQERALTAQLQKQLKQNDELKKKGIKRLDEEIQNQTLRFDELDTDRTELSYEVEELLQIREEDAERVSELNAKLQNEKRNLSSKAEEVGDLQGQNTKMTEEIELIGETHKALETELEHRHNIRTPTPPGLTEEQKAMLESLDEEERALEVQDRKNSTSKELEDFKLDNQRFMQEMNTTITQGKQDHISLSNEDKSDEEIQDVTTVGAQLQRDLRDDDKEIQDLETILEEEQQKYQQTFTKRQNEVDKMEREINDMEFQIAEKKQKVEDMGPGFAALEKAFEERTDAYEKQKKDIVELKGKKNQLEEKIRQAKDKKERMADPQEKLRKELKQKRHEVIFQLKHQGEETKEIESQIYGTGCKVKTILDENQRIEDGIKAFNKEIDDLHYQMEYNEKLKVKLLLELANTKDILGQSWDEDTELQQRYSERDQLVVDGLGELLDRTVKREETISAVTGRLEVELQFLSDFLDNLASRRPKDSREGRRPLSQVSSISRASSSRSLPPLEMADTHSPSRPTTSKSARSGRNVVISEEVTEIAHGGNERTKTITKSM
ncbi:hypothetical protein MAR_000915 [Mya arenaria]|uniref:Uncharacterized protein n=1 Tax=Mya arenaria TaxID=6604 RepID=A0ABY7FDG8_MYAAR|nr:hypothetical protein MAR_000915 [Mya arenaria]